MNENVESLAAKAHWWDWLRVRLALTIVVSYLLITAPKEASAAFVIALIGLGFAATKLLRETQR